MHHRVRTSRHPVLPLLLAGVVMTAFAPPTSASGPGPGQTRAEYASRVRESKARAVELMSQGAKRRMEAAQRWAAAARAAKRRGLPPPPAGSRQRPAPVNEDGARPSYEVDVTARRFATHATATVPANVRVNNTAGDPASTTQSEESIATWGDNVLVAWNDGLGPQYMGYGYSTDGGQTFTDGGVPPIQAGWIWSSDPVVTVNEKTGVFYFCGLVDPTASTNAIGVVSASFSGDTLEWGAPVLARSAVSATVSLDKPWMVADSTTGNLYLTYTTFDGPSGDHIDFQRSTSGGATWTVAVQISAIADNGRVQGSRPAVGPAGELCVTWSAIGTGPEDYIRLRRSFNQGVNWGAEVTPASLYLNFGTGAPGFNRERGVDYPSIAVDRTTGPNRGRVHLAWTESINKYDDALNTLGTLVESENNNLAAIADPFTPGQRLRGALSTTSDTDYYSFSATQGTNYIFECDSIPSTLYTMRVFCGQDTVTRLAFTADMDAPTGGRGYIIWTAPATGTYFLRMSYVFGGTPGGYRISTGIAGVGIERGRDSRDVFSSRSDGGTTWSAPVRVNDAAARYGEFLPEVIVAADGMPYVTWFDWRDDGCGAKSYQYLSRSSDGGATWAANQRFSDVQNNWTNISLHSNLAPDMGDYSHLSADARYLRPAWADGREGSPDVYTTRIDTGFDLTACQRDVATDPGSSMNPAWTVSNLNPLFGNTYGWTLTSARNWPVVSVGAAAAAPDGTSSINPTIAIPDSAAPGINRLTLTVSDAKGTRSRICWFDLTIQVPAVSVPILVSAFDLKAGVPNPATNQTRVDFSLPYAGPVRLRIYGLRGDLVRTLADGVRPAGPNSVTWDGRDERGGRAGAGAYFCRLEGFGKVKVQRLIWLR
jgi:flagellar hook capping protein FlgD